eukprot:7052471-Prymnesium_polylepis.1
MAAHKGFGLAISHAARREAAHTRHASGQRQASPQSRPSDTTYGGRDLREVSAPSQHHRARWPGRWLHGWLFPDTWFAF